MTDIDYLLIGTVTLDLMPTGPIPGGTISYAGRTAQALGNRTAALTSAASDFDFETALPNIEIACVPAAQTTTFTNTYTPTGRIQHVHGVCSDLVPGDLPAGWQNSPIVHLGPLVAEVDVRFIDMFPNSKIGITPQGWMRTWDEDGLVSAKIWADAEHVLPKADAVILSQEDLLYPDMLEEYRALSNILVLTSSADGCTVYFQGQAKNIGAPQVTEVDPTGAGDIFAAAFMTFLERTGGDPWEAARQANIVAASTVQFIGLDAKMSQLVAKQ